MAGGSVRRDQFWATMVMEWGELERETSGSGVGLGWCLE